MKSTDTKKSTKLSVNTFNHLLKGLHEASAHKQAEFKRVRTTQKMTNKEVIASVWSCEKAFIDFKLTADKLTEDYENDVKEALQESVVADVKNDPTGKMVLEIMQTFLRKRAEFGESVYDTAADALIHQINFYKDTAKQYFPAEEESDDIENTTEPVESK